jgi:hypothetical protein
MSETEVITPEVEANEALVLVQAQPIEKLFDQKTIVPILEKIALHCRAVPRDVSTELGRKAVASLAFKISKTKTFIEDRRIELVGAEKKRLALIDAEGKRVRDTLDSLRDEIRKPLSEWETREKARVEQREATILELARTDVMPTTAAVEARIEWLSRFEIKDMEEFTDRAEAIRAQTITALRTMLVSLRQAEADREELERHRKAQAQREQEARDREVAERARADADKKAKEANERADRAEAAKKAAEEKARAESEAAVACERERVERERRAEAAEVAKREADRKHRAAIHSAALSALAVECGLSTGTAKKVVEAIAKGKIPNVKVVY